MKSDVFTVLYSKHEPTDIKLLVTGKLQLNCVCVKLTLFIFSGVNKS